jgi:hypothetical protein
MALYQGQFYGGQQAAGDVLREILSGLRTGRADAMQRREQARAEADRLEAQAYARGRDAQGDARQAAQDAETQRNAELARALNLSQLRERGIREGSAPDAMTSFDLSGFGGVGTAAIPDRARYTDLGGGFYEDRDATPQARQRTQQQLIARIAQRAAQGDTSAIGEGVASGMSVGDITSLDPAKRPGTPQYLAAQEAELQLKDRYDARADNRRVAGQLRVARAGKLSAAQPKPPTEGELSGAGFLSRAMEAHGQLDGIAVPNTAARVLGDKFVTGQTDTFRQWNAVRKNFATAVLRKESGASISPSEFEGVDAMYIPMPGDSEELLQTKRANREGALRTLQIMSGRAGEQAFQGSAPIRDGGVPIPATAPRSPRNPFR